MEPLKFVTGNKRKALETEKILGIPLTIIDIDLVEIQETELENIALNKLEQAYAITKCPVIIDDVGLYIHQWNGFPGPLIKWVLKAGEGNASVLLKMLEGVQNRSATVKIIVGYHDTNKSHVFTGDMEGIIANSIRGENGFGWDAVFIPDGLSKTFAEMKIEEKAKISHRRKALDKLKKHLQDAAE